MISTINNDFFDAVWSNTEGVRCVVSGKEMRHEFFTDNESALQAIERLKGENKNVFFGVSLFKSDERKTGNVSTTRAIWIDVDTGENKTYSTVEDADAAIKGFLEKSGMPQPVIVHSGNGRHLYWIFRETPSNVEWQTMARQLNALFEPLGLKADRITTDAVRIMRVPGSFNFKDASNPKECVILSNKIATYNVAEIKSVLDAASSQIPSNIRDMFDANSFDNSAFSSGLGFEQTQDEKVELIRLCLEHLSQERCDDQPQWYEVGQVIYNEIEDREIGFSLWDKWSKTSGKYDAEKNRQRWDDMSERFDGESLTLGSLINWAREDSPNVAEFDDARQAITSKFSYNGIQADNDEEPPQFIPFGYQIGRGGVICQIDAESEKEFVMSNPMWLKRVIQVADTGETNLEIEWIAFGNKRKRAKIPASVLADKRATTQFLYSLNISGFNPDSARKVISYLQSSWTLYNRKCAAEIAYNRLGWHGDNFALSDLITPNEVKEANLIGIPSKIECGLAPKGNLENWADATKSLDAEKYWKHCFIIQTAIGSPLLKLIGASGGVLSVAGDSGAGKTTGASFGVSAYADPNALTSAPSSTENSFYENWRVIQNLPFVCNEASELRRDALQRLIYHAANGDARNRNSRNGNLKDVAHFNLIFILTANLHLQGLDAQTLNEASKRRALEIAIDKEAEGLDIETARLLNETMQENYGLAGRVFLEYVVKNSSEVKRRLKENVRWCYDHGVKDADRFCAWQVAIAKTAGEICKDLGLLRFDVIKPCLKAIEVIKTQSADIKTSGQSIGELFGDYINENNGRFSIYYPKSSSWSDYHEARGGVIGRRSEDDKTMSIALSKTPFVRYAIERGFDAKQIQKYASENGITEKPAKLIKGGKSVWCFILPSEECDSTQGDNKTDAILESDLVT